MKIKDLTGMRFGRLLVLSYEGKNQYNRAMWKCRCDCGNEYEPSNCRWVDYKVQANNKRKGGDSH